MIFIDSDVAIGSKNFTFELADSIRQDLKSRLNKSDFENFELGLYQAMIHFGSFSKPNFNFVFNVIKNKTDIDKSWQKILLENMQKDPRFDGNSK